MSQWIRLKGLSVNFDNTCEGGWYILLHFTKQSFVDYACLCATDDQNDQELASVASQLCLPSLFPLRVYLPCEKLPPQSRSPTNWQWLQERTVFTSIVVGLHISVYWLRYILSYLKNRLNLLFPKNLQVRKLFWFCWNWLYRFLKHSPCIPTCCVSNLNKTQGKLCRTL